MSKNPVPELARIFGLEYADAYCLAVYIAPSDDTWTTDYVISGLTKWLGESSRRDKPMVADLLQRLRADKEKPAKDRQFAGIIGNIGWFVQGVACTLDKEGGA